MKYRYGSHTIYKIQYHFVFVTKYRYHVLKGDGCRYSYLNYRIDPPPKFALKIKLYTKAVKLAFKQLHILKTTTA